MEVEESALEDTLRKVVGDLRRGGMPSVCRHFVNNWKSEFSSTVLCTMDLSCVSIVTTWLSILQLQNIIHTNNTYKSRALAQCTFQIRMLSDKRPQICGNKYRDLVSPGHYISSLSFPDFLYCFDFDFSLWSRSYKLLWHMK